MRVFVLIPVLSLNDISFTYHSKEGETKAIINMSLSFDKGTFTAIVGPSGCGKTTLLSILYGQLKPESGNLILNSENSSFSMGYMLQKDNLLEWRSIFKNVILGLEINHMKTKENIYYVNSLLKQYGLYDFKNVKPASLSGGMRQRAALIRTLALKPDILLLDEPFSALDYQTRLTVREDICQILRAESKTVILVTHDIDEAIEVADRVVVLTKRPACIKKIIDVSDKSRDSQNLYRKTIKEALGYEK